MCNAQKNRIAIMLILPGNFGHYLKNAWMVDLISTLKQVLIPKGHKFRLSGQATQLSFRDSINFLRTVENIQRVDASMPQDTLWERGAGTEKNLLACSVSGEAQVLFFNVSGSEFIELYVGNTIARMRKCLEHLWNKAEKKDCATANDQLLVGQKKETLELVGAKSSVRSLTYIALAGSKQIYSLSRASVKSIETEMAGLFENRL